MNDLDRLGGALWIRPGEPRPHNLRSTRPDWVGRITRGRPASSLPRLLGSVFSRCGYAHALCAGLAVDAALGHSAPVSASTRARLGLQTLREHLQRIWLDWPGQLAAELPADGAIAFDSRALARCPVFAPAPQPAEVAQWLQAHVIGAPLAPWLDAWEHDPADCLRSWSGAIAGDLPRLLCDCEPFANSPVPAVSALRVHADSDGLRLLANRLRDDGAGFTRQPRWHGECAETGTWTRLHGGPLQRCGTPWLRLGRGWRNWCD